MNFGPEWMRSAPPSSNNNNRSAFGNGSSGSLAAMAMAPDDKAADSAAMLAPSARPPLSGAAAGADLDALVYTHERMIELFRPQAVADGFVISDCVFSETPLTPVCLSAPSAKELELLVGPVNSVASRRHNSVQQQQQQPQPQQPQQPAYGRSSMSQRPNGHSSQAGPRARPRESSVQQTVSHPLPGGGGGSDGLGVDTDGESMWASQTVVRDSVGSFGADGVFRMGGGEALERPSPRSSAQSESLRVPSAYSSRAVSPATRAQSTSHGGAADGWAWGDLGGGGPTTAATAQQRQLVEHAERLKWWYRDPQGNTQGPFTTAHMQEWCTGGYFPADLQVFHEGGTGFVPLSAVISRAGRAQDAFLYSALAIAAQEAAPAALPRTASAAQVPPAPGVAFGPNMGQPSPLAGGHALQSTPDQRVPASPVPGSGGPAASGGPAQAAQLSALLKEQLLVVTAIGERQHAAVELQEQLQQSLSKLMRELAQESNSLHYRAQMDQIQVAPEQLFALQQQARAAEERLRNEYAQLMQIHAAHIAQLEAKTDPIIRGILLHSGAASAVSFISQRLHELSAQLPVNEPPQQAEPVPPVAQPQAPPAVAAAATQSALQPAPVAEPPAAPPVQPAVDEAAEALDKLVVAGETPAPADSATDARPAASSAPPEKQRHAGKPAGKQHGKQHGKPAPAAKKQPEAPTDTRADHDSQPQEQPEPLGAPEAKAAAVVAPAAWSSATAGTARKQPRKSLLQIQQEEEAEAARRRQQAANEQRALDAAGQRAGASYADRLGSSSASASQPRSLAATMEEQYRESTAAGLAPMHNGQITHTASAQPSPAAPAASQAVKPAAPAAKAATDSALPSLEFLQWCHARLGSLRGVNPCKFIEMLLTFPVPAPEATLEIISEQVYAYSTTLNGRAFAEDFAKRRRKDYGAVNGGSAKSAPANWAQLLAPQKAPPAQGSYRSAVGQASAAPARQPTQQPAASSSSFQVVGKKGRK
ncbi:kinesin-like protein [Coemansia spiralis]|nr:kinesin-like protein [Coemansia spiralis]